MDEAVATFTELTGASPGQARQYLSLADESLEQAVQLFFETGGSLATETPQAAAPPPSSSRPAPGRSRGYTEDEDGVVHLDSDGDEDFDMGDVDEGAPPASAAQPDTEDDEALARRLQQEMYAGAGRDPEGVRAPMARTTETLVGPGSEPWETDDGDVEAMIAQQMAQRQARRIAGSSRPGIFNQRDTQSRVWEDPEADPGARAANLARATGGASTYTNKAHSLAEMFRPPFEIISRVPWDQARQEGRDKKKWLLVNVQDPSVFDCQVLNRDLWKDERVVAVIKENFLFLQYSRDDPRGTSYMQYYFSESRDVQDAYPHIAIIDPRTGEQVKVWSGRPVPKVVEFLEALIEFLDRYSLDDSKKNPVAKRKPDRPKERDVARMTEEEMLEMAMQASLANGGGGLAPKPEDPDDLTKSMEFGTASGSGKGKAAVDEAHPGVSNGESAPASPFSQIPSDRPHVEPPPGPLTTRIQFRQSQGRVVRRFALSDPVSRIYEWLKAEPSEGKDGLEFDLMFMGKNLMDVVEKTIEEAGLKNGSVNMEYLGMDEE